MASAEKKIVPTPVYDIVLTMSEAEADTLSTILGFVGGDPKKSPRQHTESISKALKQATGKSYDQTREYNLLNEKTSVSFRSY